MRAYAIVLTGLLLAGLGCSRAQTHSYEIFVRNETPDPITIGVTKDGPPFEARWASPEQLAVRTVTHDDIQWGVVIPPGRTADTTLRGEFPARVHAWLRIYRGADLTLDELMAISRDSPYREDARLRPGENVFTIQEEANRLTVTRHQTPGTR